MGTRADFYVGRGANAEWLGSIAWDGYPAGVDELVIQAMSERQYRAVLAKFAESRDDWTKPEDGWPWPWEDSGGTDYAYTWDGGPEVLASAYGQGWWAARGDEPEYDEDDAANAAVFPDMKERQNVTFGKRSGLIVLAGES